LLLFPSYLSFSLSHVFSRPTPPDKAVAGNEAQIPVAELALDVLGEHLALLRRIVPDAREEGGRVRVDGHLHVDLFAAAEFFKIRGFCPGTDGDLYRCHFC
jgi:hypothetical protein